MAKLQFIPSPAIDGFYLVVNTVQAKLINTKIGDVDFSTISKEQADALHASGSIYLKPLTQKRQSIKKPSPNKSS
jgi:hypothetical protein